MTFSEEKCRQLLLGTVIFKNAPKKYHNSRKFAQPGPQDPPWARLGFTLFKYKFVYTCKLESSPNLVTLSTRDIFLATVLGVAFSFNFSKRFSADESK
jgi:hypothetical protein